MDEAKKSITLDIKGGVFFIVVLIGFNCITSLSEIVIHLSNYFICYYGWTNPSLYFSFDITFYISGIYYAIFFICTFFSNVLEIKFRKCLIILILVGLILSPLLYFISSFALYFMSCGFLGIPNGLAASLNKYLCLFFPEKEGVINFCYFA